MTSLPSAANRNDTPAQPFFQAPFSSFLCLPCEEQNRQNTPREILKSSLMISVKPVGVGAACQPWMSRDEQPGLLTHIGATKNVPLCAQMRKRQQSVSTH
jgi:hypothetical protein